MRIPIIYTKKIKKFIHIEKQYKCEQEIIPLGADCHPAYTLQSLHLRKNSYPFDWLNMEHSTSVQYINENINTDFSYFTKNIYKNDKNYYVAEKFPDVEFMHEKYLETTEAQEKFNRRIKKFKHKFFDEKCIYITCISFDAAKNDECIASIVNNLTYLSNNLKNGSTLHIYIRYDEQIDINDINSEKLYTELINNNFNVVKYIRHKESKGIWGSKNAYPKLLTDLKIGIKLTFPKIFIK